MTNEIKEILFLLHNDRLTESGKRKLEDYITNLQEEKQRLLESADCLSKGYSDLEKRIDKAIEYINKYEYQKYCPGPYEKDKYIMREEKEGQNLLDILRGDE